MTIGSTVFSETRFTTNSPVSRMFRRVSFGLPGSWLLTPIPITGGSPENALKKENGAAFNRPLAFWVTTHAIGRGVIVATSNLYCSRPESPAKSKSIHPPQNRSDRDSAELDDQ